jgi:hypothetical protein
MDAYVQDLAKRNAGSGGGPRVSARHQRERALGGPSGPYFGLDGDALSVLWSSLFISVTARS